MTLPTRRATLAMLGALPFGLSGCAFDLGLEEDASFDEILEALHGTLPSFGRGLSNHGPMVIEALVSLGFEERIGRWIEGYEGDLEPLPEAEPIPEADRNGALGDTSRTAEWIASYVAELEEADPRDLLSRDWDLLGPGLIAGGWHGLLRIAHASRSLARETTPARRAECAHALGYWAAHWVDVPGTPGAAPDGLGVLDALRQVPLVPESDRVTGGLISGRLLPALELSGVEAVLDRVDLAVLDVSETLGELCGAAARMYFDAPGQEIVTLHAVTGTSALRLLLPWLDDVQARRGLGWALQAVAAVRSGTGADPDHDTSDRDAPEDAELLSLASESDDAHVIKATEVVLRELALTERRELRAFAKAWAVEVSS